MTMLSPEKPSPAIPSIMNVRIYRYTLFPRRRKNTREPLVASQGSMPMLLLYGKQKQNKCAYSPRTEPTTNNVQICRHTDIYKQNKNKLGLRGAAREGSRVYNSSSLERRL